MTLQIRRNTWQPADTQDIKKVLLDNNLWIGFKQKKIHCVYCNDIVTYSNLGALSQGSVVSLVCKNPDCINGYLNKILYDKYK